MILVTGASGFLGSHLVVRLFEAGYEVAALDRDDYEPSHSKCKKVFLWNSPAQLVEILEHLAAHEKIEAIFHCAAQSSFAGCELDIESAERVNVDLTQQLLEVAKLSDTYFIFCSTDLVFDGNSPAPIKGFDENVQPVPTSAYARTKYRAERQVSTLDDKGLILRISLMYGAPAGRNGGPLHWIIEAAKAGSEITAFHDEWRTPLFVNDLCDLFMTALLRNSEKKPLSGVYHCSGAERLSRPEFIALVLCELGITDPQLNLVSRTTASGPTRPEDVSLSNALVSAEFQKCFTSFQKGLRYSLKDIKSG